MATEPFLTTKSILGLAEASSDMSPPKKKLNFTIVNEGGSYELSC